MFPSLEFLCDSLIFQSNLIPGPVRFVCSSVMGVDIRIVLNNPEGTYYPGEEVAGIVIVENKNSLIVKGQLSTLDEISNINLMLKSFSCCRNFSRMSRLCQISLQ